MKISKLLLIKCVLALLILAPQDGWAQDGALAMLKRAREADEGNNDEYAVFFSALFLQRSTNKNKIAEAKDILDRKYDTYISKNTSRVNTLKAAFPQLRGDAAVENAEEVYAIYKSLLRTTTALSYVPEDYWSIQSNNDKEVRPEFIDFLEEKVEAKKQVLISKEVAVAQYLGEGLEKAQSDQISDKKEALDILEKALKYNNRNPDVVDAYAAIRSEISGIYSSKAVELLKKGGLENTEAALAELFNALDYANNDAQMEVIGERIEIVEDKISEIKAESLYQNALSLSKSSTEADLRSALTTLEKVAEIDPEYKDLPSLVEQTESRLVDVYLNSSEVLFNKEEAISKAEGLEALNKAEAIDADHEKIIAFREKYQEVIDYLNNILIDSRDGKVYPTVKIGEALWTNLNFTFSLGESQSCYPPELGDRIENKEAFCEKYGHIYDSKVLSNQLAKLIPPGWHLPSIEEWDAALIKVKEENSSVSLLDALSIQNPNLSISETDTSRVLYFATSSNLVWNAAGEEAMVLYGFDQQGNKLTANDARLSRYVFVRLIKDSKKNN